MSNYTLSTVLSQDFPTTVSAVREALTAQGFGVISEIDLCATLRSKLGVDLLPQLILGACRPDLAHRAIVADPSVATVLPCNVVVRSIDPGTTVVEVFNPAVMAGLTGGDAMRTVARDAGERLRAMLATISQEDRCNSIPTP